MARNVDTNAAGVARLLRTDKCFSLALALPFRANADATYFLRGQGADVLYVDEAAYTDLRMFYNVVVPILEVVHAVLLMISTLCDAWNWYTRMLERGKEMEKEGKEVYLVHMTDLICDRCKGKGNDAVNCRHKLDEIPPWKSAEKLDTVAVILGRNNRDILARESMNFLGGTKMRIFTQECIDKLKLRPFYERQPTIRPKKLFIIIDPNAGGASHAAICAMTRIMGQTVVCAAIPSVTPLCSSSSLQPT